MKATGIVRRIDAGVIKTPKIYITKAEWKPTPLWLCIIQFNDIYILATPGVYAKDKSSLE